MGARSHSNQTPSVPARKGGDYGQATKGDKTACSECQNVQGRHSSTCSRRPQ